MGNLTEWRQSLVSRLKSVSAQARQEVEMDRSRLQRDWLYNSSLTAFAGALLMLLAWHLHISDQDVARRVEPYSIRWAYSIQDWVAPHLNRLDLPLSAILFVIAFTLLAASTWRKTPMWAAQLGIWISFLVPIFVWVGLFTAWLPLVGDLFTSDPNVGVVVFYVGFSFLVLISVRPIIVRRLNESSNNPVARGNVKSDETENGIRKRLRDLRTSIIAMTTFIFSLAAKSASNVKHRQRAGCTGPSGCRASTKATDRMTSKPGQQ